MTTAAPADFPLRIGGPSEFSRVADYLRNSGFDQATLCRLFGMEDMSGLGAVQWGKAPLDSAGEALRCCLEVFLRGSPVEVAACRQAFGPEVLRDLEGLGLVRPSRKEPAKLVCPVWLYPVEGFLVASDRRDDPDGQPFVPPADIVFPAIYGGTLRFLKMLPEIPGTDALDMCGGSGIGALHFSRCSRSAVTADITRRAELFADFNGRLNGAPIESLRGDLFEPVAGRQFDIISAHPPFVPATGEHMVYRDAGETGEDITRRIIESLPVYLRAGGTAVVVCVARDTDQSGFERRVQEWLGSAASSCEILFGVEKLLTVSEVVESMRKRGQNIGSAEADRLRSRLESAHTSQFAYGTLFIRRHPGEPPRLPPTRLRLATEGQAEDFLRLLAWRAHTRTPEFQNWLYGSRPRLAPKLELNVRHLNCNGELTPAEVVFSVSAGFESALKPDAWVAPIVARLTGESTVQEIYQKAAAADELPAGFPLEAFGDLVKLMIERGFLTVTL